MKFQRLGLIGHEQPVVVEGTKTYSLEGVTQELDGDFLSDDPLGRTRDALARGALSQIDPTGLRIGAPIARPQAVWCIGMNYAAHAAESGSAPPEEPIVFLKSPNTVVGPNDDIILPVGSSKTDWEVELAVVIGKRASYLPSPAAALGHIAGYSLSNDLSEREFQIDRSGGQWSKGKCCAAFNPLGPSLIPAGELDPGRLRLRSFVNGNARQDSSTSDLIFGVDYLVWHLSQFAVLEPGDVINTGTPEGVALSGRFPYLQPGDLVEMQIDGIGATRQVCRRASVPPTASAAPAPQ